MSQSQKYAAIAGVCLLLAGFALRAQEVIPHAQDKPPGPALSPEQAIRQMVVPEGFVVELVASEPMLVNPIAMCFDERGRIWVTESLEYPRNEPGVGRDRVKVLEDTDGDGKADKSTIFADGLNIPSGIAVGHGGVWVSNPPDILFMQDTDGDGKADKREVVVTGFGRQDTHEMANSLTWGPDGYLYGQNGVFVRNVIEQDGKKFDFSGAIWRIHPRTRKFEIFAEGLSNPWGITFNENGEMFVSACVIDHLWHVTQGGQYIRQAGAYPAHAWPIPSIVDHKHQKAAYCGIVWFDSDAYPQQYREKLYMGNIHGNCINADALERNGSTYKGKGLPDLMSSGGDAWFMPVAQKVGPDGCLYILDWYDRYHCYQDARRDSKGIDRLKGRLYRLKYVGTKSAAVNRPEGAKVISQGRKPLVEGAQASSPERATVAPESQITAAPPGLEESRGASNRGLTPPANNSGPVGAKSQPFDLGKLTDDELIAKLGDPNVFIRETSQRLLNERNTPETRAKLQAVVLNESAPRKQRLHAMWSLISTGSLEKDFHLAMLKDRDATVRAWGVRAAGNYGEVAHDLKQRIFRELADDSSPDVRLQGTIAATRVKHINEYCDMGAQLYSLGEDTHLAQVVWQNLYPQIIKRINSGSDGGLTVLSPFADKSSAARKVFVRAVDIFLSHEKAKPKDLAGLVQRLIEEKKLDLAEHCIKTIAGQVLTDQLTGQRLADVKQAMEHPLEKGWNAQDYSGLQRHAAFLAAMWGHQEALKFTRDAMTLHQIGEVDRLVAFKSLVKINDPQSTDLAISEINSGAGLDYRRAVVAALGKLNDPKLPAAMLAVYPKLDPALKPAVIELLIQRPGTAGPLLDAIEKKEFSRDAVNLNQVRSLASSGDAQIKKRAETIWGKVRAERNPAREKVIEETRKLLAQTRGDVLKGREVFTKICGQCHAIYGQGQNIGPDLTGSGRSSLDQLLSNVLDPSLVVGEAYQLRTVAMKDGRVLAGMVAEQNDQRVVLKIIGGQEQILAAGDVKEITTLPVSFMPEGLEAGLSKQELADLFAFLLTDKPPEK